MEFKAKAEAQARLAEGDEDVRLLLGVEPPDSWRGGRLAVMSSISFKGLEEPRVRDVSGFLRTLPAMRHLHGPAHCFPARQDLQEFVLTLGRPSSPSPNMKSLRRVSTSSSAIRHSFQPSK